MFRKYWLLLTTITLLCSLEFLQTGMIAFASAPIRGEIEASPEEFSLVAALYACLAVISIAKQRWLTERFGWRNYLLTSIGIYIVGAVICSVSADLVTFTAGRVVMALGGGGFMTSARVMVQMISPGPYRFTGIKAFAIGLACGTSAAPVLSSLAVAYSTWQAIFWILIVVAMLVAMLALRFLPTDRHPVESRSQSRLGQVLLLAVSSFSILYVLQRSYYDFYNETAIILVFAGLAAFALLAYLRNEKKHPRPLLKVHHVINRRYVYGIALFCFSYLMLGANNYVLPSFLQSALGYSWETVGHFQSLGLLGTLAAWLLMSWLLPKSPSPKKFFTLGFLSLIAFSYLLAGITPGAEMWTNILPALFLNGCFVMFLLATAATQTFKDVGHDDALFTNAQQLKNMAGQIATASGTALATIFMQWRSTVQYDALNVRLHPDNPVYAQYVQQLSHFFARSYEVSVAARMAVAEIGQTISQQATMVASIEYFSMIAVIGIAGLIFSLVQKVFRA
jgi:DHA2 family multidrug resistance protein